MKTRYRIKRGWFGSSKVLLQVEYTASLPYSGFRFPCWRDATEEDMQIAITAPKEEA